MNLSREVLVLFVLSAAAILSVATGDAVDDVMELDLTRYNVRGGGVTCFDSVSIIVLLVYF